MKKYYNPKEYSEAQMQYKLEMLREFQEKYPGSHVGGSVGLYLHGINLQRDISRTDLDITVPDFIEELKGVYDEDPSDASDFDYVKMHKSKDYYFCCKIEIRVCPEPSYTIVEFEGHTYNVSLLSNILFWKRKYARKGVQKHIDDLITIETGVRPVVESTTSKLLKEMISLVDQMNKLVDERNKRKAEYLADNPNELDLPF